MGPLHGVRVIEIKGIGPGPYAGMLLADLGADVIVVERDAKPNGIAPPSATDVHSRGKRSIALNLKTPAGVAALLRIVAQSDVLIEGFRPGVAERLGFGPEACHDVNPRLVFGRLTGWGQDGPLANTAGHDINYIGIVGALAAIGSADKPTVPLNLVGDYAGGSLFLVIGILAALLEAKASGQGQIIDAAITDGAAHLMSGFHGWRDIGFWNTQRANNLLDGAAPNYDTYATSDGRFLAIGALEPQFTAALLDGLGLADQLDASAFYPAHWPQTKQRIASVVASRTQAEWLAVFDGSDACVAPVLNVDDAPAHPHNQARKTYVDIAGVTQPAPAPRFSRSACSQPAAPHAEAADSDAVLAEFGYSADEIAALRHDAVLR
ncbi:MAG: CaiB/BaiF CoA-transferase family protein [Pseudomonadota bacterium]